MSRVRPGRPSAGCPGGWRPSEMVLGVLGSSWGSWQAVTPMRSPGREAFVGEASRDGRRSDFREGGVTGTGGGRTSVTIVSERSHTSALSVDKDAGNVTLSGALRPFSGRDRGIGDALSTSGPLWGPQSRQRARDCWTTREEAWSSHALRDGVGPPSRIRATPVALSSRSGHGPSTPLIPAPLATATACPGPWREGRVPLPGRQLKGPDPFPPAPPAEPRGINPPNRGRRGPLRRCRR